LQPAFFLKIAIVSQTSILGTETADDAGFYKIYEEMGRVLYYPHRGRPFLFGQIAAANLMSDVCAMGEKSQ